MYSTFSFPTYCSTISWTSSSSTSQTFQVRIAFRSWAISRLTTHIEHLDRVREKVLLLDENTNVSSGEDLVTLLVWRG